MRCNSPDSGLSLGGTAFPIEDAVALVQSRSGFPTALSTARDRLAILDVNGRDVSILKDGCLNAGRHVVAFEGSALPSGIYFYRLIAGAFVDQKKMLLAK